MLPNEGEEHGKKQGLSQYQLCCKKPVMEIYETAVCQVITAIFPPALFPSVSCGTLPGFS